jgi:hypothetical protein
MRKSLWVIAAAAVLAVAVAFPATAASPHFKQGGEPVCTVTQTADGPSTQCRATLAGLGNEDLLITVSMSGSAVYTCQNKGGNTAPGQNKVLVGPAVAPTLIDSDAIKNGNVTFTTNPTPPLNAPDEVSGAAAGCPNGNWKGVNPVLTVSGIDMVIEQPPGTVIFTCTSDDVTGTVSLSCE